MRLPERLAQVQSVSHGGGAVQLFVNGGSNDPAVVADDAAADAAAPAAASRSASEAQQMNARGFENQEAKNIGLSWSWEVRPAVSGVYCDFGKAKGKGQGQRPRAKAKGKGQGQRQEGKEVDCKKGAGVAGRHEGRDPGDSRNTGQWSRRGQCWTCRRVGHKASVACESEVADAALMQSEMTDVVKLRRNETTDPVNPATSVQREMTRAVKVLLKGHARVEAKVPPTARRGGNRFETLSFDEVGGPWEEAEKNKVELESEVVQIVADSGATEVV